MWQAIFVPRKTTPKVYRAAFCKRLQVIRDGTGLSQGEFAKLLGIHKDTYAKYETRSLMPLYLIPRVCEVAAIDSWYLLTGKGAGSPQRAVNPPQRAVRS